VEGGQGVSREEDESKEEVERENEQDHDDNFVLGTQAQSLQVQGSELEDDGRFVLEEEEMPSDDLRP